MGTIKAKKKGIMTYLPPFFLFISLVITLTNCQTVDSYDKNDWIPITKPIQKRSDEDPSKIVAVEAKNLNDEEREEPEEKIQSRIVSRKAEARVLNIPDEDNSRFFPENQNYRPQPQPQQQQINSIKQQQQRQFNVPLTSSHPYKFEEVLPPPVLLTKGQIKEQQQLLNYQLSSGSGSGIDGGLNQQQLLQLQIGQNVFLPPPTQQGAGGILSFPTTQFVQQPQIINHQLLANQHQQFLTPQQQLINQAVQDAYQQNYPQLNVDDNSTITINNEKLRQGEGEEERGEDDKESVQLLYVPLESLQDHSLLQKQLEEQQQRQYQDKLNKQQQQQQQQRKEEEEKRLRKLEEQRKLEHERKLKIIEEQRKREEEQQKQQQEELKKQENEKEHKVLPHGIEQDFIQQALEAHKLQVQFKQQQGQQFFNSNSNQNIQQQNNGVKVEVSTLTPRQAPTPPVTKKRKAHQPPLAVYMDDVDGSASLTQVLAVLKSLKTIPVQDSISTDSPQVFVGPSNLETPEGYVKYELPYLNSIDSNRIERKVDQLPFFVAPLSYKTPPGYAKIPLPSPHVGSVVVNSDLSEKREKSRTRVEQGTIKPQLSVTKINPYSQTINHYELEEINNQFGALGTTSNPLLYNNGRTVLLNNGQQILLSQLPQAQQPHFDTIPGLRQQQQQQQQEKPRNEQHHRFSSTTIASARKQKQKQQYQDSQLSLTNKDEDTPTRLRIPEVKQYEELYVTKEEAKQYKELNLEPGRTYEFVELPPIPVSQLPKGLHHQKTVQGNPSQYYSSENLNLNLNLNSEDKRPQVDDDLYEQNRGNTAQKSSSQRGRTSSSSSSSVAAANRQASLQRQQQQRKQKEQELRQQQEEQRQKQQQEEQRKRQQLEEQRKRQQLEEQRKRQQLEEQKRREQELEDQRLREQQEKQKQLLEQAKRQQELLEKQQQQLLKNSQELQQQSQYLVETTNRNVKTPSSTSSSGYSSTKTSAKPLVVNGQYLIENVKYNNNNNNYEEAEEPKRQKYHQHYHQETLKDDDSYNLNSNSNSKEQLPELISNQDLKSLLVPALIAPTTTENSHSQLSQHQHQHQHQQQNKQRNDDKKQKINLYEVNNGKESHQYQIPSSVNVENENYRFNSGHGSSTPSSSLQHQLKVQQQQEQQQILRQQPIFDVSSVRYDSSTGKYVYDVSPVNNVNGEVVSSVKPVYEATGGVSQQPQPQIYYSSTGGPPIVFSSTLPPPTTTTPKATTTTTQAPTTTRSRVRTRQRGGSRFGSVSSTTPTPRRTTARTRKTTTYKPRAQPTYYQQTSSISNTYNKEIQDDGSYYEEKTAKPRFRTRGRPVKNEITERIETVDVTPRTSSINLNQVNQAAELEDERTTLFKPPPQLLGGFQVSEELPLQRNQQAKYSNSNLNLNAEEPRLVTANPQELNQQQQYYVYSSSPASISSSSASASSPKVLLRGEDEEEQQIITVGSDGNEYVRFSLGPQQQQQQQQQQEVVSSYSSSLRPISPSTVTSSPVRQRPSATHTGRVREKPSTTKSPVKIRARIRGRTRGTTTTTTTTTTKRPTYAKDGEDEEEEEFYGFFRTPSFSKSSSSSSTTPTYIHKKEESGLRQGLKQVQEVQYERPSVRVQQPQQQQQYLQEVQIQGQNYDQALVGNTRTVRPIIQYDKTGRPVIVQYEEVAQDAHLQSPLSGVEEYERAPLYSSSASSVQHQNSYSTDDKEDIKEEGVQIYTSDGQVSSTPVQFVGEIRPKYSSTTSASSSSSSSSTTTAVPSTTTTAKNTRNGNTRGRSRVRTRVPTSRTSSSPSPSYSYTASSSSSDSYSSPSYSSTSTSLYSSSSAPSTTLRGNGRVRTRGKSHYKPPQTYETRKQKQTGEDDEDIEGENYPVAFLKGQVQVQPIHHQSTQKPAFQISFGPDLDSDSDSETTLERDGRGAEPIALEEEEGEPEEHVADQAEEEDQATYGSILQPKYLLPNSNHFEKDSKSKSTNEEDVKVEITTNVASKEDAEVKDNSKQEFIIVSTEDSVNLQLQSSVKTSKSEKNEDLNILNENVDVAENSDKDLEISTTTKRTNKGRRRGVWRKKALVTKKPVEEVQTQKDELNEKEEKQEKAADNFDVAESQNYGSHYLNTFSSNEGEEKARKPWFEVPQIQQNIEAINEDNQGLIINTEESLNENVNTEKTLNLQQQVEDNNNNEESKDLIKEEDQKQVNDISEKNTGKEGDFFDAIYKMFGLNEEQTKEKIIEKQPTTTTTTTEEVTTQNIDINNYNYNNDEENVFTPNKEHEESHLTNVDLTPINVETYVNNQQQQEQQQEEEQQVTDLPIPVATPAEEYFNTQFKMQSWDDLIGGGVGAVKTSTSTEVSHETEICFRGRCVRSTSDKTTIKV